VTVRVSEIKRDWAQTQKHWEKLYTRLAGCNTVKGNLERLPVLQLLIPKGVKTILDIGGSDGQTSEYFKKAGYDPTVLNIDADKDEICRAKGLKTLHADPGEKP
jgi:2-polyprenyl-3-methyl-5-hydroxy-6-metoxy-1,4-benzoquinol methylase